LAVFYEKMPAVVDVDDLFTFLQVQMRKIDEARDNKRSYEK